MGGMGRSLAAPPTRLPHRPPRAAQRTADLEVVEQAGPTEGRRHQQALLAADRGGLLQRGRIDERGVVEHRLGLGADPLLQRGEHHRRIAAGSGPSTRRQQALVQRRRGGPLSLAQVGVAAREGEPVVVADDRTPHDLHRHRQVGGVMRRTTASCW